MEHSFKQILQGIGENTDREGLRDTPERAANAMRYLTKGYTENLEDIINGALFESEMSEMVIVKDIEMYSMCEHHLVPFYGKVSIGYLPCNKILGHNVNERTRHNESGNSDDVIDLYGHRPVALGYNR